MSPLAALVLGALEGLTEFLPISSTGHLILAAHLLRLGGEVVNTFEIVIQAGALAAVAALYRRRIAAMLGGLAGRNPGGRALALKLAVSFLPAGLAGLLLHRAIEVRLFGVRPVAAALAAGGVLMILAEGWAARRPSRPRDLASISLAEAFVIGCAQCLALWPGASRAMVTLVAGLLLGLPSTAAAEYSFLLALPTLGSATAFAAVQGGSALMREVGMFSLALGFVAAALVAAAAIRGFIRALSRWGLAPWGWYRLALAAAVWCLGLA